VPEKYAIMQRFVLTVCCTLLVVLLHGQVTGTWKTIDDETGEAKSHVEINISSDGVLSGKIVKLLLNPETTLCDRCPGDLKNKPVMQMVILKDMRLKDGYYQGGTILDPNNGKSYKCKLWLKANEPNVLELRGSIGPFYRTQQWYRV
jgi:uncharacterized protein (DUF2147 family)